MNSLFFISFTLLHFFGAVISTRSEACDLLIAIDTPLYENQNKHLENITDIVLNLVEELNTVYQKSVFKNQFSHIYFRVKEIRILENFCNDNSCNSNVSRLLNEFTALDTSSFCLAHLLTYRDFPGGTVGLANLGPRYGTRSGTFGPPTGAICTSVNTGFTSFLNYGVRNYLLILEIVYWKDNNYSHLMSGKHSLLAL